MLTTESSNSTALSQICSNQVQDASVLARKTAAGKSRETGYQNTAIKAAPSNKSPRPNSNVSHPPSITTLVIDTNGKADKLKDLLLELSRDPDHADFKTILRLAADQVRITAFGYNRETTKRRILKLIAEFECLEIEDISDETSIDEKEIREALVELNEEGKIKEGKRRRWQEPGKHYNAVFYLV